MAMGGMQWPLGGHVVAIGEHTKPGGGTLWPQGGHLMATGRHIFAPTGTCDGHGGRDVWPHVRDHIRCSCLQAGASQAEQGTPWEGRHPAQPSPSVVPAVVPGDGDLEGWPHPRAWGSPGGVTAGPVLSHGSVSPPPQECEILDIIMKMCCEYLHL